MIQCTRPFWKKRGDQSVGIARDSGGGSVSAEPSTIFPDSGAPPGLAESIESAGTILPHAVLYRECMIGPSTLV